MHLIAAFTRSFSNYVALGLGGTLPATLGLAPKPFPAYPLHYHCMFFAFEFCFFLACWLALFFAFFFAFSCWRAFSIEFLLHCHVGLHCPLHFWSRILSRQLVCIIVLQFAPYTLSTIHIPRTGSYRPKASKTCRCGAAGWAASYIGLPGPVNGPSQTVSQGKCKKMQTSSDSTRKCKPQCKAAATPPENAKKKKKTKENARQNAKEMQNYVVVCLGLHLACVVLQ